MGLRGPKPEPTALKLIAGPRGRRAKPKPEPSPEAGDPTCPDWLKDQARKEWERIVPVLQRHNLFTVADRTAVSAYCQAHEELVVCTEAIRKQGRVVEVPVFSRNGKRVGKVLKTNPMVKLQRDAFTRVKQFLSEFGLSPSARTRLTTESSKPNEINPIQELMQRGKPKAS